MNHCFNATERKKLQIPQQTESRLNKLTQSLDVENQLNSIRSLGLKILMQILGPNIQLSIVIFYRLFFSIFSHLQRNENLSNIIKISLKFYPKWQSFGHTEAI